MTDFELGWFCGLIDGEGCIGFKKNRDHYTPHITMTNTSSTILREYERLLRKIGVIRTSDSSFQESTRHKVGHHVSVQRRELVKIVLEKVVGKLVSKDTQANLVLEFVKLRDTVRVGHGITHRESQIVMEVSQLNRKGTV